MGAIGRFVTRHPWITIILTLGLTVFFAYHLKFLRIDNEVKNFLPDDQEDKQNYIRMQEIFSGEMVAIIGVSVDPKGPYKDVFNPTTLRVVRELTDWLKNLKIESPKEHWVWAKPEEIQELRKTRNQVKGKCTTELLQELEKRPVSPDLDGMIKVNVCTSKEMLEPEDVVSLATMKVIYDKVIPPEKQEAKPEHQLTIEDLWKKAPTTQAEADQSRKWIESWEMYKGNIVSHDLKSTVIMFFLPTSATIQYVEKLQVLLDKKITEIDKPDDGITYQIAGLPLISVWLGKYLVSDLRLLIPFVFAVIILVLIISFKRPIGVIWPTISVMLATIWTVGLVALIGKPLTIITSALPTLIVAVGSAYTIHVVHHYLEQLRAGESQKDSLVHTLERVGMAIVMAGLTTVGGFSSLMTTTILPIRDFGMFASFGTFASLTISLTFIPAVLSILKKPKIKEMGGSSEDEEAKGPLGRFLKWLAEFIMKYKWRILGVGAVMVGICVYMTTKVVVTSDIVKYFPKDSPIRTSDDYLNQRFGGTNIFSLVIDGGRENYWKDPANLRKLERLLTYMQNKYPDIGATLSVLDYIKKMNMALEYDDPKEYRIPDTQQAVADCLFLFAQKSDTLKAAVDFDYRRVRVAFKCRNGQTYFMYMMKQDIDSWFQQNWPELMGKPKKVPLGTVLAEAFGFIPPSSRIVDAKYYFSGPNFLRLVIDRLIVVSQIRSLMFALIVVFFLAAIIFKSFVGGFLSVIPTFVAVFGNFALMVLTKIPLDVGTALVSAGAVGCGIDYAIHYTNRYRLERAGGYSTVSAVTRTHLTTSKAIIFNATAVALGFFVLALSNFKPVQRMGLLTGITMFTASFAALVIVPIFLVVLRPRFIRKAAGENGSNKNGGVS